MRRQLKGWPSGHIWSDWHAWNCTVYSQLKLSKRRTHTPALPRSLRGCVIELAQRENLLCIVLRRRLTAERWDFNYITNYQYKTHNTMTVHGATLWRKFTDTGLSWPIDGAREANRFSLPLPSPWRIPQRANLLVSCSLINLRNQFSARWRFEMIPSRCLRLSRFSHTHQIWLKVLVLSDLAFRWAHPKG